MYFSQSLPYLKRVPVEPLQRISRTKKAWYALLFTILVIPPLPVNEKYGKVSDVEIRDRSFESRREGPCKRHEQVAAMKYETNTALITPFPKLYDNVQVIWVTRSAPPARCEQLGSPLGRHICQVYFAHCQLPRLTKFDY